MFFCPHKWHVLVLCVLSLLVGVLEAANVAAVYPILSEAFDTGAQESFVLSLMFDAAGILPIDDPFIAYGVLFLVIAVLAFLANIAAINFRVRLGTRLVEENQKSIFNRLMRADYQYFVEHKQGDLIYNTASAPVSLSTVINVASQLIGLAILIISIMVLLFSISWQGTLAVLFVGVIYYYFIRYLGRAVSYRAGKGEVEATREGTVILNEAITGVKQIKAFAAVDGWIDRFNRIMKERWYHFRKRTVWQQVPAPILMLVLYLVVGIIAIAIKLLAPGDFMDLIPVFGTFAFAMFRLFPIIGNISNMTMQVIGVLPNVEIMNAMRNELSAGVPDAGKDFPALNSEIRFEKVSFGYKGRSRSLEDITFAIRKGEMTAIVGRSGIGKTTIVNLVLGLYQPDKGEITVDGVDLGEYKLSSWLEKVGFVDQDTFITNDTIRNNITFRSNSYSGEEIVEAARFADAHDFITEMPDGYDTLVGDKGLKLSAGQRQRIAVARAVIRKPELLIFDEATNALDNISEAAVQRAIEQISQNKTVIVIAHRLSTVIGADKIIVLGDRKVLEQGTHQELLDKKGMYWELYRSQVDDR